MNRRRDPRVLDPGLHNQIQVQNIEVDCCVDKIYFYVCGSSMRGSCKACRNVHLLLRSLSVPLRNVLWFENPGVSACNVCMFVTLYRSVCVTGKIKRTRLKSRLDYIYLSYEVCRLDRLLFEKCTPQLDR